MLNDLTAKTRNQTQIKRNVKGRALTREVLGHLARGAIKSVRSTHNQRTDLHIQLLQNLIETFACEREPNQSLTSRREQQLTNRGVNCPISNFSGTHTNSLASVLSPSTRCTQKLQVRRASFALRSKP